MEKNTGTIAFRFSQVLLYFTYVITWQLPPLKQTEYLSTRVEHNIKERWNICMSRAVLEPAAPQAKR